MSLPNQSLLETKAQFPPERFAALLRGQGPVSWWGRGNFWLVTDHKLATALLKSPDFSCDRTPFFLSRMPHLDPSLIRDFFGVVGKMMVMSDGDRHAARRGIAALGLADEVLDSFAPRVEATVRGLIDRVAERGRFDFVTDLARHVPSLALAELFSIPESERESFYRWSNNMTQFFGGASQYRNEDGIEVNQSAVALREYFTRLMEERRRRPQGDFLSILLQHQQAFGLTDAEIVSQAVMMLVAGQVTTTDQMANNFYTLMTHPGALAALRLDPSLLRTGIEELNRLDPAVTFIFRVTARDTQIGDQPVPQGATIFVSTHAVNRDPAVFPEPEGCELGRRSNPHFAYGVGPHVCIGAKLARIEMMSLFGQLLERFPELRLDSAETVVRKHHSLAFSGFDHLPVVTGRAAAPGPRTEGRPVLLSVPAGSPT